MTTKFAVPPSTTTTPQGSAKRFIQVLQSQVGNVEGPKSNETLYGKFTKANFLPWCGSLIMWGANESGVKVPNCVLTKAGAASFESKKRFFNTPEVGDLVFMSFANGPLKISNINHIGLVTRVNSDGTVDTIEGNTTVSVNGDERNGGEVAVKTRAYTKNPKGLPIFIVGFGRPEYTKAVIKPAPVKVIKVPAVDKYPGATVDPGEFGDAVKFVQKKLGVEVDGMYGPVTKKVVIAFQEKNKSKVTPEGKGVVGPKTWLALSKI